LRELALRQAAHEVEHRLSEEETRLLPADGVLAAPRRHHKILALVTANPRTAMVIRRAKRVSDFLGAECFAVAVQPTGDLSGLDPADREAIERHLNFARNLHIETRVLEGDDVASTLVDFGRRNQVTQIFLTRPERKAWPPLLSRDPAQKVLSLAKDMLIVIVSDREPIAR
jgi:two-component system sensor histidine kinase KdpD